jgi:hypothetical protein
MKKDIQNYFDTYRSNLKNKSLISTEEVRSLINSSEDGSEFNNNKFRNIRRYVIMSTVASILVTAILLMVSSLMQPKESKKAINNPNSRPVPSMAMGTIAHNNKDLAANLKKAVSYNHSISQTHNRPLSKLEREENSQVNKEGLSNNSGNQLASNDKKPDTESEQPKFPLHVTKTITDTSQKNVNDLFDDIFPESKSDTSSDLSKTSTRISGTNITGINMMELTSDELKKLDITLQDSSVEVILEVIDHKGFPSAYPPRLDTLGYDQNQDSFLVRKVFRTGTMTEDGFYDMVTLPNDHRQISEYSRIAPVTVSLNSMTLIHAAPILKFLNDETANFYYKMAEGNRLRHEGAAREIHFGVGYAVSLAKRLLPVKLPVMVKIKGKLRPAEMNVWFYPNEEFLSALPERYSEPLRKELAALADIEENNTPVEIACKGLENQETFFDICRMKSGAIEKLSLFPNPATESTTAQYILDASRKLKVTLHDINGKFLRTIKEDFSETTGTHDLKIVLDGIQSGFYLVAIQSDKGEQVVQRLIVN